MQEISFGLITGVSLFGLGLSVGWSMKKSVDEHIKHKFNLLLEDLEKIKRNIK